MSDTPGDIVVDGGSGEEEAGKPVPELAELLHDAPPGFTGRVSASLRRRALASQLVTLSWSAAWVAVTEFLQMGLSLFGFDRPNHRGKD